MENLLKNNLEKYIHIYADCIPVRGATKSAVYDLTREELTSFPTPYYDLLVQLEEKSNKQLIEYLNQSLEKEAVYDLIAFLFEFEFAMFTDKPSRFPKIKSGWEIPSIINDAIIDIDQEIHDMDKIMKELDYLGCRLLEIRGFSSLLSLSNLSAIMQKVLHKSIQGVTLIIKYDPALSDNDYKLFIEENPIVSSLTIHSANANRVVNVTFDLSEELKPYIQKTIQFSMQKIDSESHCGKIHLKNLSTPSVPVFFENKKFNGCLNGKISVDKYGAIKNCPSMTKSYGNIKNDSLEVAVKDNAFKQVWLLNKDQIDTCNMCELRYICSDCRAYTQDSTKPNAKPIKCGYDPYLGEWNS